MNINSHIKFKTEALIRSVPPQRSEKTDAADNWVLELQPPKLETISICYLVTSL